MGEINMNQKNQQGENFMKNKIMLFIALFFGLGLSSVFAQEWSPAQKEVWKNVNDYWALMAKGDLNGFFEYFHQDYVGWDNGDVLPSSKEESKKMFTFFYSGVKVPFYEIKPLAIKIYGDFAFVHYLYVMYMETPDGKKKSEKGRWTDILTKQGNKWVMIGDHGGRTSKD
jgi:ketosteroid isomerase-like protein